MSDEAGTGRVRPYAEPERLFVGPASHLERADAGKENQYGRSPHHPRRTSRATRSSCRGSDEPVEAAGEVEDDGRRTSHIMTEAPGAYQAPPQVDTPRYDSAA